MAYTRVVHDLPVKTLAKGLSKTRKGSPSIGIHALIDRAKAAGFDDRLKQAISEDEALDAAKTMTKMPKGRARRYTEGAVIGGAAYPLTSAAGEVARAAVAAPKGQRAAAAGKALVSSLAKPEIARNVVRGALGGSAVQAVREGVELGHAKKTVKGFLDQHKPAGV